MIEQRPAAIAVSSLREEDLEGIVAIHADGPRATVTEQMFHFGSPLGVSRAAKAEAMREEAGPIFACAQIPFCEAGAPKIFGAFFAVPVMSVAPEPRGERLLFVIDWPAAGPVTVLFSFSCKELIEGRAGQLAWIPGVISFDLWVANVGVSRNRD